MPDSFSKDNDVRFAFDILLEEIEGTVESLNKDGSEAFTKNNHELASQIAADAKEIAAFRDKVKQLYEEWTAMDLSVFGTSVSKTDQRTYSNKLQRGLRTPENAYRLPILEALSDMGGSGQIKDVLNRVYKIMQNTLNEYDHQPITSTPNTPRWYNTAQWCRAAMVKEGLLKKDSPHGTWEISNKGLKELEKQNKNN